MTLHEIVEDSNCVSKIEKLFNADASDVTSPASDKYIHSA
jgi:hypothetical protein